MDLVQPELVDDVLAGLAGLTTGGQAPVLLQSEHVIWLGDADVLRLQGAHQVGHRSPVGDAESDHGAAGETDGLRGGGGKPQPASDAVDSRTRDVRTDLQHYLIRYEAVLARRWHAGEAALAR